MAVQSDKTKEEKAKLVMTYLLQHCHEVKEDYDATEDFENFWVIEQVLNYPQHLESILEIVGVGDYFMPNAIEMVSFAMEKVGVQVVFLDVENFEQDSNCTFNMINDLEYNHGDYLEELCVLKITTIDVELMHYIDEILNTATSTIITSNYKDCIVISANVNDEWCGIDDWGCFLDTYEKLKKEYPKNKTSNKKK